MSKNANLISALEILNNYDFFISDLPTEVNSALWPLIQQQLGFSIAQLSALQNFTVTIHEADLKMPVSAKKSTASKASSESIKKLSSTNKRKSLVPHHLSAEEEIIEIIDTDDSAATLSLPPSCSSSPMNPISKKLFEYQTSGSGGFIFVLYLNSIYFIPLNIFCREEKEYLT